MQGAAPEAVHQIAAAAGVDRPEWAIGFGLWVVSESLSFMPGVRANGVLQLLLSLAMRAFPYEPPRRKPEPMTLTRFLRERGRRRR